MKPKTDTKTEQGDELPLMKTPKNLLKMIDTFLWASQFKGIPPCFPRSAPSDRYCELFGFMRCNT